jgi:VanZ family protein
MFRKPLLPVLLWTIIIGVLTLVPGNYIPKVSSFLDWLSPDKLVHLFLFGIYTLLLCEGFSRQLKSSLISQYPMIISFGTGMVFAFFTEMMQAYLIPGRNGNVYDFLADTLGCLLGLIIWKIIMKK